MSFLKSEPAPHNERFSLLLLEPGEIYFEDFSAFYYPPSVSTKQYHTKRQKGRLKMCSKSLVFDPIETQFPILKFPMKSISDITEGDSVDILRLGKEVLQLTSTQTVQMMERNAIAPYKFVKVEACHRFSLNFATIDDCLSHICQLHRASTLNIVDSKFMTGAIVKGRQNRVKFDTSWLEDLSEKLLLELRANHISPLVTNPGRLMLTNTTLYFQPFNNVEPVPVLKIRLCKIRNLIKRRYLLRHIGLEIYSSKSQHTKSQLYLSFMSKENRDDLYDLILKQLGVRLEHTDTTDTMLRWQNGQISNYDYLLHLNSEGDRSFNDLTQYPIMPWVVADYTSSQLDLTEDSTFRDLSKPIGALNPARLQALKERWVEMADPKFLYGSHYSTPGCVLFYLARVVPEYMLCLQNGNFDHPDRMFNSMSEAWENVQRSPADFKELIPEFYTEEFAQFLSHKSAVNFGVRSGGRAVTDVLLPSWANNPEDFVKKLRQALESDYVSRHLHQWIDLIFGYKQRGEEAVKADNVFYHLTYEGGVDLDKIHDPNERAILEIQIMEFGQVPKQLFTKRHPPRLSPSRAGLSPLGSTELRDFVIDETKLDVNGEEDIPSEGSCDSLTLSRVKLLKPHLHHSLHKQAVTDVTFSHDGKNILSVSQDCLLKMYSLEDQRQLRSINLSSMSLSCVSALPDNSTVIVGSWDNAVYVYSMEYGQVLHTLNAWDSAHNDAVSCVQWSDGQLFTASWDSTVKVWDCPVQNSNHKISITYLRELEHDCRVTCLDKSHVDHVLATGTDGGTVHLWDVETFTQIERLKVTRVERWPLETVGDHVLATGTDGGTVHVWDVEGFTQIAEYHAHHGMVNAVRIVSDLGKVLSCGSDSNLKMWDMTTGSEVYTRDLGHELLCMAVSSSYIFVGASNGDILVFDVQSPQVLHTLHHHSAPVTCLCVKNASVISGYDDGKIVLWKS